MSLINDALKRAQQAPQSQLPTGPMLRPVEPEPEKIGVKRAGLLLPMGLAFVAIALLVVTWYFVFSGNATGPKEVRAVTAVSPPAVATVAPSPDAEPEVAEPAAPVVGPDAAPAVAAPVPAVPAAPAIVTASAATEPLPAAAPASVPVQAAPQPTQSHGDLKLQGIVLSKRPSAMISGLIVYPGDVLSGLKVVSIGNNRVELASESQTIVLTLR